MPLDFTKKFQHAKTFKLVRSVREIMNAIQGPGILSLNSNNATSIPTLNSEDGQNTVFNQNFFVTDNMTAPIYDLTSYVTSEGDYYPNFVPKGHDLLYVRRDGNFAPGIDAVNVDRETYANSAARNTRNAPDRSLFGVPYIFSNFNLNEVYRSLCIKYLHRWLRNREVVNQQKTITVWKLDTLNDRIARNQSFDVNTNLPFPRDTVPLDLTDYQGVKLIQFGTRIVDLSNTFEGQIVVPANTAVERGDEDLARVLDRTLIKQDIDFGLFLCFPPYRAYKFPNLQGHVNVDVYEFRFDPVEAIFSYLTAKKYEPNDYTLSSMIMNTNHFSEYGVHILASYRLALSYLIQESKKQLRYWLTNGGLMLNNTYNINTIKEYLTGPTLFNIQDDSLNFNTDSSLAWIPYEFVKYYNDAIDFDTYGYEAGKQGVMVPKKVRKPRSYTLPVTNAFVLNVANVNPYFQKYALNNVFQYDIVNPVSINAWPIALVDTTFANGHIYKATNSNDDNIIHYDHVDNSEYFPEPDIVTDI